MFSIRFSLASNPAVSAVGRSDASFGSSGGQYYLGGNARPPYRRGTCAALVIRKNFVGSPNSSIYTLSINSECRY
jgi:hypothetical protein